ncbi:MAG: hypothetical protein HY791_27140 [Deltaproteobacteria bacterium]|nr:hypothetical protein [Deltaproteobacteria bacterium]
MSTWLSVFLLIGAPSVDTSTGAIRPTSSSSTSSSGAEPGGPAEASAPQATSVVDELLEVEIHGFVSQGVIKSTANNFLAESSRGSFEVTEAGLNFTKSLTDKLRVGLQLFSRDLGPIGNYDVKLDWYYLDYRWSDWFGLRAGRTKVPFGLYNEISDVDSARVPILLPPSIYPSQNRDFLLAQTGIDVYGYGRLGAAGSVEYSLYGGTIFIDVPRANPSAAFEFTELDTPYLLGGRVFWSPLEGLRLGASLQALELDATLYFQTAAQSPSTGVLLEIPAVLWVASLEYTSQDFLFATEYSRWRTEARSSDPERFPTASTTSERLYGMASYRVSGWFCPGVFYAVFFPDAQKREGRSGSQQQVALTLRFDLNPFWILKLEGSYMRGTAGLSSSLNDNQKLSELVADWGLFMAKTTAYF